MAVLVVVVDSEKELCMVVVDLLLDDLTVYLSIIRKTVRGRKN